jgi:hypothetical protein
MSNLFLQLRQQIAALPVGSDEDQARDFSLILTALSQHQHIFQLLSELWAQVERLRPHSTIDFGQLAQQHGYTIPDARKNKRKQPPTAARVAKLRHNIETTWGQTWNSLVHRGVPLPQQPSFGFVEELWGKALHSALRCARILLILPLLQVSRNDTRSMRLKHGFLIAVVLY